MSATSTDELNFNDNIHYFIYLTECHYTPNREMDITFISVSKIGFH